jgi:hypothetical protein
MAKKKTEQKNIIKQNNNPVNNNKLSCMKKWGILSWSSSLILTFITIIGVFCITQDMTVMGIICGLSWGETAVFDGCYAYKERAANKQKIAVQLIKDLADKYGIDSINNIVQAVIQD